MTFGQSISTVLSKYAVFTGRARRSEYWWFVLFQVLVSIGIGIVGGILSGIFSGGAQGGSVNVSTVLSTLVSLALLLPSLAVLVRRLHDANYSGWFALLLLIPFVGGIVVLVFTLMDSNPAGARFDPPTLSRSAA